MEQLANPFTIIRGACGHDCPDTCSWLVEVRDGKAERMYGDPAHPFTRGTLCAKVNHYLERVYHPDRILHPLKRVGAKGEGRFVQTTWDEALADISARWHDIIAESGAEAIQPFSFAGNQGLIQMASLDRRLSDVMGFSKLDRSLCGEVAAAGLTTTNGCGFGVDPEELVHSRYIVLWGTNTIVTNLHLWPVILEARARGARIVVVDPVKTVHDTGFVVDVVLFVIVGVIVKKVVKTWVARGWGVIGVSSTMLPQSKKQNLTPQNCKI